MYVQSARGRLIQGLARLGSLTVRGVSAARARRRSRQEQAAAVARMASGGTFDEPCEPCAEEQRRLQEEAAAFMRGR